MASLKPPFPAIKDGLLAGRVIPFLGAGASLGERNARWSKEEARFLPTTSDLAEHLAHKATFPRGQPRQLPIVAQYYRSVAVGADPLKNELHEIFARDYPLTSLHRFLASLPPPLLIVTTNYDDLIERAFSEARRAYDVVVHIADPELGDHLFWWQHDDLEPRKVSPKQLDIDLTSVTVIYKMHGTTDRIDPRRDQYVITEDDYVDFLTRMTRRKAIPAVFAEPFQTRPFLFLGYGLHDWNFRVVLNEMAKKLRRPSLRSWAIDAKPSALEARLWQDRGVEIYKMSIEEFVSELAAS
jgi:hypothetical protein